MDEQNSNTQNSQQINSDSNQGVSNPKQQGDSQFNQNSSNKGYVARPTTIPNIDQTKQQAQETLITDNVVLPSAPSPILQDDLPKQEDLNQILPDVGIPKAVKGTEKNVNLATPKGVKGIDKERKNIVPSSTDTAKVSVSNEENNNIKQVDVGNPKGTEKGMDQFLQKAVELNASDLHVTAGYPIVIRIDGELETLDENVVSTKEARNLIYSVLSDEKQELLEVNKEIDFAYSFGEGNNARFRINAYYSRGDLSAAFRLIPSRIRTIEDLKLPQLYHRFAQLKQGLILVTGPTGHGKSTTIAAILEDINRTRFGHIVTIEDPIEYVFQGKKSLIDQREMNSDTHSWTVALKSALRQDPDVILVGEMRDYETIASAITLAETGHLVFATLHTNSAAQTVDRIIDVFPENQQAQVRTQVANILEAVIAQRLIPLDEGGRRAVSEIMLGVPSVKNLIREGRTHLIDNVIRTSSDVGMISLESSLVKLVREGIISIERAQEYAVYPEEIVRAMKK